MAVKTFKPGEVDPTDKKIAQELSEGKEAIDNKYKEQKIAPEASDLSDQLTLGGLPARPLSAGIVSILEMIDHPMFSGDVDEEDLQTADVMILLFLLVADCEESEFVSIAVDGGYKEMKKAALTWSFSIDPPQMQQMSTDINRLMDQFNNTMDLYSGSPGGEEGKK